MDTNKLPATAGKIVALPYQREGVRDIEDFDGRALLADDMGLGKTMQALWFLKRKRVPTLPALVVCPASVKYHWEHEAFTHVKMRGQVLEGRTPPKGKMQGVVPPLTIINPDILKQWLPYLRKMGIQTVILDECQMFQNPAAGRTKAAMQLCRDVRNVVALSGTPLTNRPAELWPTLNMIRPDLFPSFFSYAQEYCQPRRAPWGWEYKGAENIPQLHTLLRRNLMIRRLKKDVVKDLPDKVRAVVPMELSRPHEYRHASGDFLGWMKTNYGKIKARRAAKAAAVTRIGYLLRLAAKLKARAVVAWANKFVEEFPDEKLVLFAIHKKMIDVLSRRVNAKSVVVDGNVVKRRRKHAVDQFRQDPDTRIFIGNIKAAGTGVDGLQDVCSNLAFAEMWWRPGDHVQAEDRIHRIGQKGGAWISYLVAGGTIEEDLCRIIQAKQAIIRATLDGETIVEDDLDVWDQLIQLITGNQN